MKLVAHLVAGSEERPFIEVLEPLRSYGEVETAARQLFELAGVLWPEESAEHEARLATEEQSASEPAKSEPEGSRSEMAAIAAAGELPSRQKSVLELIEKGFSNHGIAEHLGISLQNVYVVKSDLKKKGLIR